MRKAVHSDLEELQEVINKAYDVETGNTGVSFKRARRYRTLAEVEEQMKYLHVLLENEVIVGGVRTVVSEDFKKVSIGPVAVHPDHQVRSQNSRNTRGAHKQFQNNNKSGFTELSFSRVPKTGIRNEKEIKVLIFSFLGVGLELATLRL